MGLVNATPKKAVAPCLLEEKYKIETAHPAVAALLPGFAGPWVMLPIRKIHFQNRTVCFCLCFLSSMVWVDFPLDPLFRGSYLHFLFKLLLQTATRYFPSDWIYAALQHTIDSDFLLRTELCVLAGWLAARKNFPPNCLDWSCENAQEKSKSHELPHRGANSKRDKYEIPITQKCADRANTRPERRNF